MSARYNLKKKEIRGRKNRPGTRSSSWCICVSSPFAPSKKNKEGGEKKNLGLGHQFSKLVEPALLRLHKYSQN